jgi:ATP-grasp domain, R2K clade family 3
VNAIWLIDADCPGMRSEQLQSEIRRQGHSCRAVRFFPETRCPGDIAGAESVGLDARVIYFGGPALMRHIQSNRRWTPGGWFSFPNFSCDIYYTYFGKYLLNSIYSLLPSSEALRQSDQLFATFAVKGELFVRPSIGRKLFTGSLVDPDGFQSLLSQIIDHRTLIVITSPKTVEREWRLFVVNNEIVTHSQYARRGVSEMSPHCPDEVIAYGAAILQSVTWRPDPLFTMDVCESGGSLYLLELNGFSCSNLYECDLGRIVRSVALAEAYT